jgi:hypothetical protein
MQTDLTVIVTGLMNQADTNLFKIYKNRTASWFKEFSGPQVISLSSKGVPTYSATRQVYVFRAASLAYDLYVQVGILCLGTPNMVFMLGSKDISKTA